MCHKNQENLCNESLILVTFLQNLHSGEILYDLKSLKVVFFVIVFHIPAEKVT